MLNSEQRLKCATGLFQRLLRVYVRWMALIDSTFFKCQRERVETMSQVVRKSHKQIFYDRFIVEMKRW